VSWEVFLIFLFISVLLSDSNYSSSTTFTVCPLWWKTPCPSSILLKDRRGLCSRLLGWLSVVLQALSSRVTPHCKPTPAVSGAGQSLSEPSCPVQSSCVTWGTSARHRPQRWAAVKHEACLELKVTKSLKCYCSLKAVNACMAS